MFTVVVILDSDNLQNIEYKQFTLDKLNTIP